MKLRCLIIDDEPLAHKVILEYTKDVSFLEIVGQCYLATEALSLLNNQEVDLLFLDINMPKLKGLDFLKTLQKKPIVIITSAYEEYALESFELSVCDYLLKPFRFERFLKSVNKALEFYQMKTPKKMVDSPLPTPPTEDSSQIFIKSDKRYIQIDLGEIYYLESYGNYVKIWLENVCHLTPRTLSSFENELPSSDFYRIHKSFIVHRKFIDYLEGNILMMKNKKSLPVGKNHRGDFKKFIQK
ncbi:MAG: LytR/AlgR family response regulator transcription factor [Saprospiraceae bacterium]